MYNHTLLTPHTFYHRHTNHINVFFLSHACTPSRSCLPASSFSEESLAAPYRITQSCAPLPVCVCFFVFRSMSVFICRLCVCLHGCICVCVCVHMRANPSVCACVYLRPPGANQTEGSPALHLLVIHVSVVWT